jgi:hypothetical protein
LAYGARFAASVRLERGSTAATELGALHTSLLRRAGEARPVVEPGNRLLPHAGSDAAALI